MTVEFQPEREIEHIEVKVGPRSGVVEQSELDNLIEAVIAMRSLAASGKAIIDVNAYYQIEYVSSNSAALWQAPSSCTV
jgi:hypothetical protein